jgi:membrane protein DedA with SNARE-associated domain
MQDLTEWVVWLIDAGGYWGIALLMVIENIFPPIPSELIMGIAGIRVGQGRLEMGPLLVFATIGTTLGNYCWYLLGRTLGFERLKPVVDRYGRWMTIRWADVEKIADLFVRYGPGIVFFFRFLPVGRTIVSLPAGLFRMGHVKFLIWTAAGALIWNIILAYAGSWLGSQFSEIDRYLGPAATITLIVALGAFAYRFITWDKNK